MLRIAVPNKGSLSESAVDMLREAGYAIRRDTKELVVADPDNDAEFFYLRPRDIAIYVGSGHCRRRGHRPRPAPRQLQQRRRGDDAGFGRSTFRYAARPGDAQSVAEVEGKRVATSYPGLVEKDLAEHGVRAAVVRLDGAVETAITLGVADVIADVVETGATLRSQGLAIFGDPILHSEAVLIRRVGAGEEANDSAFEVLRRRLLGVVTARNYVMMDYDVPANLVDEACRITPGLESPTVSHLQDRSWCAVRAMVPRSMTNRVMDELYDLGARAILVTDIAACRL